MSSLISVIVPVYNTPCEYIKKCIQSLINQDYSEFELLIVDDGSRKDIADYCDQIQEWDSRIKVIHKKNGGVSSARNIALKQCIGTYVSFVDSDDWVEKDFLSSLIYNLKNNDADLSICNISYDKDGEEVINEQTSNPTNVYEYNKEEIYTLFLHSTEIGGFLWNKLFKKELITNVMDEDLHYSEDFVFVAKYTENIVRAVYFNKKQYHYIQNQLNATNDLSYNRRILTLITAYKRIEKIYKKNSENNIYSIERNILKIALNIRARYKINKIDNNEQYYDIKSTIREYFWKILFSSKIRVFDKINIVATLMFPKMLFKIKCKVLSR